MSLRKYFQNSLDLPGVAGAFCITRKGELVESFMPAPYTDDVFEELGPRLVQLTDAIDMSYSQTNELLMQFESNALYLRRNENAVIGFFTVRNPLLSGLRVSANLLLKQTKTEIDEAIRNAGANSANEDGGDDDDDEDDSVILKSASEDEEESKSKSQRKGLFGKKKKKKPEANDIWG